MGKQDNRKTRNTLIALSKVRHGALALPVAAGAITVESLHLFDRFGRRSYPVFLRLPQTVANSKDSSYLHWFPGTPQISPAQHLDAWREIRK